MTVSASQLLPIIVLLPLLGAIVNGFLGHKLPKRLVFSIGVGTIAVAFLLAVRAFYGLQAVAIEQPFDPALRETVWTWAVSGLFQFDVAFFLDPLSAVMLLVVTGVGLLIHVYSTVYMGEDPSVHRYFAYLNLFMFSMLVLILGKNLFMMFVGWEGVGVCSYFLIGFWFTDDQKAQAGQKAFVVNRIGDVGFVIGLALLIYHARGTTDYDVLKWLFQDGSYGPFYDPWTLTAACLLFFVGAAGKSAQLPLYVWLPDAMAGPTPVSALIHAATMVTAGVYMMCRLSFMYTLSPTAMGVIATVGALTALAAALMAITQRDIKKVLAYSTVSQLGYMVMAVGVGAFFASIFHVMTHAFFKALLFLAAGSVIHAMHHEQDIFKMGGLRKKLPITAWTFLIGTIAIAGVPFFSGHYSKDAILWEVHSTIRLIPVPQRSVAVYMDADRMFVGGRSGTILRGEGDTWTEEQVPVAGAKIRGVNHAILPDIRAIAGDGAGTYWAAGAFGTAYRSGGRGWTLAHAAETDPAHLNAVWTSGPDNAWFVGDRGLVLHWDGSAMSQVDIGTSVSLMAVNGLAADNLHAAGSSGTLLKYDGKTWKQAPGVGTTNIIGLVRSGDTLIGATERGDLLTLGVAGWQKVALKAPGLGERIQLRTIAAGPDGQLVLGGRGQLQGSEKTQALALRGTVNGGFTILPGPVAASFQGAAFGAEGIMLSSDDDALSRTGCALYTAGNADVALGAVTTVPTKPWFHHILWAIANIGALLTAFYMFRLYFLTFEGETRSDPAVWNHCHENPPNMVVPLMILAALSIGGGWFEHGLHEWLEPVFRTAASRLHTEHHHGFMPHVPTVMAAIGIALATLWYYRRSSTPKNLAEQFPTGYRVLYNKFYVDEIYDLAIVRPYRATAKIFHEIIDRVFVDGFFVHGTAAIWNALGRALRPLQSGNVQHYAVAIAVGLAVLVWFVGMKPTLW